jgi:hypothetical protein
MSRSCKGGTWVHVVPYTDPNSADGVAPTRTCRLCVYDFQANSLAPLKYSSVQAAPVRAAPAGLGARPPHVTLR